MIPPHLIRINPWESDQGEWDTGEDVDPNGPFGQSGLEMALALLLVAIVVIFILTILGPRIGNVFSQITEGVKDIPIPTVHPLPSCNCNWGN